MMQQRQLALKRQQQRSAGTVGQTLVMANKDVGTVGASAPSPSASRPSTGLTYGRPTTAGSSMGTPSSMGGMAMSFDGTSDSSTVQPPAPLGAASANPNYNRSNSILSTASVAERDTSGVVMPDFHEEPGRKEEENKRRSSLAQELDERGILPVFDPTPGAGPGQECHFDIGSLDSSELK